MVCYRPPRTHPLAPALCSFPVSSTENFRGWTPEDADVGWYLGKRRDQITSCHRPSCWSCYPPIMPGSTKGFRSTRRLSAGTGALYSGVYDHTGTASYLHESLYQASQLLRTQDVVRSGVVCIYPTQKQGRPIYVRRGRRPQNRRTARCFLIKYTL